MKSWTYLKKGVNTYGGFNGTENKLKDRDMTKKSTLVAAPANTWPSIYGNVCLPVFIAMWTDSYLQVQMLLKEKVLWLSGVVGF